MTNRRAFTHWVKITDAAKGEIICIILNALAPFAFFAANRTNKGVVQLRFFRLKERATVARLAFAGLCYSALTAFAVPDVRFMEETHTDIDAVAIRVPFGGFQIFRRCLRSAIATASARFEAPILWNNASRCWRTIGIDMPSRFAMASFVIPCDTSDRISP